MLKRLTFVLITLAAIAVPRAAEKTAWFGTPLPPPLSDPRKPIMKYDDAFGPLPTAFAHRPGKSDELLDGAALKADQKRIVGFSLESQNAGDKVWGRRAATPAFMHTLEWTVSEMKAAGLKDAKVETFPVPGAMWVPKSWKVELQSATRRSAPARETVDAAVGVSAARRRLDSRRQRDRAGRLCRARYRRRPRRAAT